MSNDQPQPQPQPQNGPLGQVRENVQKRIDKVIDTCATKIPGASQYSDKAKGALSTILQNLQKRGEGALSGLFGGGKKS